MPLQMEVNQTNYTPFSYCLVCVLEDSVLAKTLKLAEENQDPYERNKNE